ncbi:putative F-box/kelch-repeat protein At1g12870 [Silene latifolia]|uniref:putative F-box/kelch-repeat protein At1g12870 n=1 Tax=Silene latifolia TaxID=37657 RepID=UPI003D788395
MENKDSNSGNGKQVMMISQQSNLSDELIFEEILTRFPVKSILRFKSVSKQWYSTLSSSHFTKAHLKKSPFSHPCANLIIIETACSTDYLLSYHDEVEVDEISQNFQDYLVKPTYMPWLEEGNFQFELLGSCNGLVCIASREGEYFLLWNPATRKLNKYASPALDVFLNRFDKFILKFFVTSGFGHVSSADDYKFVGILKWVGTHMGQSIAHPTTHEPIVPSCLDRAKAKSHK